MLERLGLRPYCFLYGEENMLGKVTPLLPNALCLSHSIVHELFFADHKFASAGREDVDVRMLGNGMLAPHVFSS